MESARQMGVLDERRADLNQLLIRLDSQPEKAWEEYRSLHRRLVRFFEWNNYARPEDLADEALDRVARKPPDEEIKDVSQFVIGVARYLLLEAQKKSQRQSSMEDLPGGQESLPDPRNHEQEIIAKLDHESHVACLRECLGNLKEADQALALSYYSAEEEKQKVHRRKLAQAAGITINTLRVRANRLREKLEQCLGRCLQARSGDACAP
jgi:DNA-directed RNA polymerase specialized sigma24 family protein